MNYLPLHIYSSYTILGSGFPIQKLIQKEIKERQEYLVVSDLNSLSAFPLLANAAKQYEKKALYGFDLEIDGTLFSFYIQNEEGYKNAVSLIYEQAKNTLDYNFLLSHLDGLRVIIDVERSRIRYLYESNLIEASSFINKLVNDIKGIILGIPYTKDLEFIDYVRKFASSNNLKTIAFPFIKYEKKEDEICLKIVNAIANDLVLENKTSVGLNYYLEEDVTSTYYDEDELKATFEFASSSTFEFFQKRGEILVYPNNKNMSSDDYLTYACMAGLKRRKPDYDNRYLTRLNHELNIIKSMGYSDYFLIVADYVSWAKKNGISVGPGRGSAAGSLVSFCLGIISPDPIKYDLLFERFLNPQRQTMPDIDVDFSDIRRNEVSEYLMKKYGTDRVSHIRTMQTLGAKASLRDIGRVFNYEPRVIDLLCKTISDPKKNLRENYKDSPKFKQLVDSDPYYLEIVSLAAKIEGLPRQTGLHAAGVVINNSPLETVLPLSIDPVFGLVEGYEAQYLEDLGLLKMDILGLKNLTIVDQCIEHIKRNRSIFLDYSKIPWEDEESIKLIAENKTVGLFQLESAGMNSAIRQLKPTNFDDIVALLALYRPGPMAFIPTYAARKAGKEKITYIVPELEEILAPTYGIIVYQEQIMRIVQKIAGYDYGKADLFRRAISKKDAKKLEELKLDFIRQAVIKGYKKDKAEEIFAVIHQFANYGFNKSHSLVYAILACQMAFLKCNYPEEFYCAILDTTSSTDKKFEKILSEVKQAKLKILLPDINTALDHFTTSNGGIIYPLSGIRGMTGAIAKAIIAEREENGKYIDTFDFAIRNLKNGLTKELLVRLISVGCFDSINPNRTVLRVSAAATIDYAETMVGNSGNDCLLDLNFPRPKLPSLEDNKIDNINDEKQYLGVMISGSPLSLKQDIINKLKLHKLAEIDNIEGEVEVAAIILDSKVILTKKNKKMAFLSLYDETYELEGTMFSDVYTNAYPLIAKGALVRVTIIHEIRHDQSFYTIKAVNKL